MTAAGVISVAGAKGSPGVTFVAAGLAGRLAGGAADVLAIDADAEDGALCLALGLPDTDGGAALARSAALGVVTPDLLRRAAAPAGRRLWLLECQQALQIDGAALLSGAAEAGFGIVVADLGHLFGALHRQLAAGSGWLAWVVQPDRLGLDRADRLLAGPPLEAASAGLVFNRIGRRTLKGAERVLSERHRLPILAKIHDGSGGKPLAELARAVAPANAPPVAAWP